MARKSRRSTYDEKSRQCKRPKCVRLTINRGGVCYRCLKGLGGASPSVVVEGLLGDPKRQSPRAIVYGHAMSEYRRLMRM